MSNQPTISTSQWDEERQCWSDDLPTTGKSASAPTVGDAFAGKLTLSPAASGQSFDELVHSHDVQREQFNFSTALSMLKGGGCVQRAGWNGKGMFLYLVPANSYPAQTGAAKAYWGEDALVPYGAYIAMKTAQENVVPWLASQTDILATDWQIV